MTSRQKSPVYSGSRTPSTASDETARRVKSEGSNVTNRGQNQSQLGAQKRGASHERPGVAATAATSAQEHPLRGSEELAQVRIRISRFLAQLDAVQEEINDAYAGQPFLPDLAPDAPANRRRFNTYLQQHGKVTQLLVCLIRTLGEVNGDRIPQAVQDSRHGAREKRQRQR